MPATGCRGLPERQQVVARQAVGRAVVELLAARYTGYRRFTVLSQGGLPGPEAGAGKLSGTAAARLASGRGGSAARRRGGLRRDGRRRRHVAAQPGGLPGLAIAGGTDQVLRNILGERVSASRRNPAPYKSGPVLGERNAMNFDLGTDQRDAAAGARQFFAGSASRPTPGRRSRAARSTRATRRWPRSASSASPSPRTPAGGGALLDLAVVAEQGGAVLAGPSLVTAARAAVLLADHPSWRPPSPTDRPRSPWSTGPAPSIDAAERHVLPRAGGRRPGRRRRRGHRRPPIDATRGLAAVRLTDRRVLREEPPSCGPAPGWWARRARRRGPGRRRPGGAAGRRLRQGAAGVRPSIGSYQAVKHLLVDAWVGVDQLRSLVWWAAWAADNAPEEFPLRRRRQRPTPRGCSSTRRRP